MINLRIPMDAVIAMRDKTLAQVYSQLMLDLSAPLIDVLTFGYVNTPIIRNSTGVVEAYVTYWTTNVITVCKVDGEQAHLLGSLPWDHWPTLQECEDLFHKYWKE